MCSDMTGAACRACDRPRQALRLALELNLTLVHVPLLAHASRGDHADLEGGADELEALLGSAPGLVAKYITEITPRIAPL